MSRETSHPARQPFRQGLPLAQFAGDGAELLPVLSPANHLTAVPTSLRESLGQWWLTNQLWISWSLLVLPLALQLLYGTFVLSYLLLAPISILATYLIYRSARTRLQSKTNEVEAMSKLHLATAEALATAIDAKDQTTHCHVRRVQIYAAGMGEVFGLSPEEIAYKLERDIGYVDSLCWECSTKINDPEISELSGFEVDGVEYVKDKDGLWVEDRPYTRAPLKEDDNA